VIEAFVMPLVTTGEFGHYEFETDNIYFWMLNGTQRVRCAVTLLALEKLQPNLQRGVAEQMRCFIANRARIERAASREFDKQYFQADGTIMVRAEDI
jgi:hypothetical protein